jgi:hypothetical protein
MNTRRSIPILEAQKSLSEAIQKMAAQLPLLKGPRTQGFFVVALILLSCWYLRLFNWVLFAAGE